MVEMKMKSFGLLSSLLVLSTVVNSKNSIQNQPRIKREAEPILDNIVGGFARPFLNLFGGGSSGDKKPRPRPVRPSYHKPQVQHTSSYHAPAPAPQYHAPSYHAPEPKPTYHTPAPSYQPPSPSYHTPEPSYSAAPAPSYHNQPAVKPEIHILPAPDLSHSGGSYVSEPYQPSQAAVSYQPAVSYEEPAVAPAYEAPSYEAPSYKVPTYEAPAPAYEAPSYAAPAPAYEAPSYEAPSYGAPAPAYEAPSYEAPAPVYEVPSYEAPSYEAPSYEAPAVSYESPAIAPAYEAPVPVYESAPAVYEPAPVPVYTPSEYAGKNRFNTFFIKHFLCIKKVLLLIKLKIIIYSSQSFIASLIVCVPK